MKKKISFVFIMLISGSFIYAEILTISLFIPDNCKLNKEAPNYLTLRLSDISTGVIDMATLEDGPWFQTEISSSVCRVDLSSLDLRDDGVITLYLKDAAALNSVEASLVLCSTRDEDLCYFVEKCTEITASHRRTGKLAIALSQ